MAKRLLAGMAPWLIISISANYIHGFALIFEWAALLIYICMRNSHYLRKFHPITWANVLLFILLFINGALNYHPWIRAHGAFVCYFVFFSVGLMTIIVGKPFSTIYARQSVPKENWNSPKFRSINYVISHAWIATFGVNAAITLGFEDHYYIGKLGCLATLCAIVLFSDAYPTYARKRWKVRAAADHREVATPERPELLIEKAT